MIRDLIILAKQWLLWLAVVGFIKKPTAEASILDDMWNSMQGVMFDHYKLYPDLIDKNSASSSQQDHYSSSCDMTAEVGRLFNQSIIDQVVKKHKSPLTDGYTVKVRTSKLTYQST